MKADVQLFFITLLAFICCCAGQNDIKGTLETVTIESIVQTVGNGNATFWILLNSNPKNISVLNVYITADNVVVRNSLGPFSKKISVSTNGIIHKLGKGNPKQAVDTLKITHQAKTALNIYITSNIDIAIENAGGPFLNKDTGSINALIQKGDHEYTMQVVTLKTDRKDLPALSIFITCDREVIVWNEIGNFTDKICISSSGITRKTGSGNSGLTDAFKIVRDNSTSLNAHISSDGQVTEDAMKNALEPIISRINDSIRAIIGKLQGNDNQKLLNALKATHRSIKYNTEATEENLATKLFALKEMADTAFKDISQNMGTAGIQPDIKAALERLKASLLQFQNVLSDLIAIRLPLSFRITTL